MTSTLSGTIVSARERKKGRGKTSTTTTASIINLSSIESQRETIPTITRRKAMMKMLENGKREPDRSSNLRLSKSKGSQDRKSFTFGRSSKNKSTGIIPPTSIACQSSGSLDESKETNSIDGDSITSKDALPSEEKFSGQGIIFKAKLIGVDPVTGPRGDKMCQSALQRLKVSVVFMLITLHHKKTLHHYHESYRSLSNSTLRCIPNLQKKPS